jgi:hypothetical protein
VRTGLRLIRVVVVLVAVAGCSESGQTGTTPTPDGVAPPGASAMGGGCGATQVYGGPPPGWADRIAGGGAPQVPYVIAKPSLAVAFLTGYPLVSGHPLETTGRGNKTLWAVREASAGQAFAIDGHPLASSSPTVHYDLDNPPRSTAGGGVWLGSALDVPTPGCWRFELSWDNHKAEVDLNYVSPGS